jgi:surface antigen
MSFRKTVMGSLAAFTLSLLPAFPAQAMFLNCVQYVRQASSIELSGNAWAWWPNAKGRYPTSQRPARSTVLVFQRTKAMPSGHVAVVKEVLDRRTIVVEHANWAPRDGLKGRVSVDLVEDVSPGNDWTTVRVMHRPSSSFGKPYATNGFIHPKSVTPEILP